MAASGRYTKGLAIVMLTAVTVLHGAAPTGAAEPWGILRSSDNRTPVILFKDRAAAERAVVMITHGQIHRTNPQALMPLVACVVPNGTKAGPHFRPSPRDILDPFIDVTAPGYCAGTTVRTFYQPAK
jgi:hypothetical protein